MSVIKQVINTEGVSLMKSLGVFCPVSGLVRDDAFSLKIK